MSGAHPVPSPPPPAALKGQMQTAPLLISSLIEFAALYHGNTEIVSKSVEGPIHRTNYHDLHVRSKALAIALQDQFGVKSGDRVVTLAWNTWRHVELYYAISGMGAVIHTVNPRLFLQQIEYIINHGGANVVFFDLTFLPIVERICERLPGVKHYVAMTDHAHFPVNHHIKPANAVVAYEDVLQRVPDSEIHDYRWPIIDENSASALCYTSGTTGNPKGVLYSHRSTVLHTWAASTVDAFGVSAFDTCLLIVPLFHANAWGMPYVGPMVGAKLVLPGAALDGKSIAELVIGERVTFTAGVPSVLQTFMQHLDENPSIKIDTVKKIGVGGSACPRDLLRKMKSRLGCHVIHAWGMTETSPLGTIGSFLPKHSALDEETRTAINLKQGRALFGVEMKITDDRNKELPRDGKAFGDLKVRGPWIVQSYFKENKPAIDHGGWFTTGDVATLDPDGFMQITDRSKDVIKSGGEWISSIDIENLAVEHPAVAQAAVIGVRHPKWQERPLLLVVLKKDNSATREAILDFLKPNIASWWMPDDVIFVNELPYTATGKLNKLKLRETYGEHLVKKAKL